MKFAYIPKGNYKVGQVIEVHGKQMQIESYSHTGRNIVVHSLPGAPKFERIVCIATDNAPIAEVSA